MAKGPKNTCHPCLHMAPIQQIQGPLGTTHLQSLATQEHERQLPANDSQTLSQKRDDAVTEERHPDLWLRKPVIISCATCGCLSRKSVANVQHVAHTLEHTVVMDPCVFCGQFWKHNPQPTIGSSCRAECQQQPCNLHVDDMRNSLEQEGLFLHQKRSNLVLRRPTWDLLSTPRLRGGALPVKSTSGLMKNCHVCHFCAAKLPGIALKQIREDRCVTSCVAPRDVAR